MNKIRNGLKRIIQGAGKMAKKAVDVVFENTSKILTDPDNRVSIGVATIGVGISIGASLVYSGIKNGAKKPIESILPTRNTRNFLKMIAIWTLVFMPCREEEPIVIRLK